MTLCKTVVICNTFSVTLTLRVGFVFFIASNVSQASESRPRPNTLYAKLKKYRSFYFVNSKQLFACTVLYCLTEVFGILPPGGHGTHSKRKPQWRPPNWREKKKKNVSKTVSHFFYLIESYDIMTSHNAIVAPHDRLSKSRWIKNRIELTGKLLVLIRSDAGGRAERVQSQSDIPQERQLCRVSAETSAAWRDARSVRSSLPSSLFLEGQACRSANLFALLSKHVFLQMKKRHQIHQVEALFFLPTN